MQTKEGELALDGTLQNFSITNYKFLEIENTGTENIEITINDGAARTYEPGEIYRTPFSDVHNLYEDVIKIQGMNGEKINYSYIN